MARLGFYFSLPPYAATGIRTHISRVAPNSWDLLKDAPPTELPCRSYYSDTWYCFDLMAGAVFLNILSVVVVALSVFDPVNSAAMWDLD